MPQTGSRLNWESPITAEFLTSGSVTIQQVVAWGELIFWSELRPDEKGRVVVCCQLDGNVCDLIPVDFNVNTHVHSYGGAAWWVDQGQLFFQDRNTTTLYMQDVSDLSSPPVPLTKVGAEFADGRLTSGGRYFICIRERPKKKSEHINEIVAISTSGNKKVKVVRSGADFYSSPRISPDGSKLAWIEWNHPDMSWDGTELWVGDLKNEHKVENVKRLAGGSWIFQPEWKEENELAFVSDKNNWSVLCVCDVETGEISELKNLEAEIAVPEWVLGESRYCFTTGGTAVYAATSKSSEQLFFGDKLWNKHSSYGHLRPYKNGVLGLVGSWQTDFEIVHFYPCDNSGNKEESLVAETIYSPNQKQLSKISPAFFQPPEFIEFDTSDDETAYGIYYAPANPNINSDSLPPLIVMAHGGPTASARTSLYLGHRFWTSRGFAVLDVNYRGSTGFGRKYRQALNGRWGIADVKDCIAGASYLIEAGLVNSGQIGIRGGSAGGLTVLLGLAHSDIFSCGAIRYGVVDISALAQTTHKFESRYMGRLISNSDADQEEAFSERSPSNHLDKIDTPLLIMSGTHDPVVPLAQSQLLAATLKARGVKHELLTFEGEGHGFRQSETQIRALNAELDFFLEVFDS